MPNSHAVLIAGAGPTGLMLAAELALAGVDVAIVERRDNQDLTGSRAGGLQARTIELFDQRGIADRFLNEGKIAQTAGFAGVTLDLTGFPTRHPYGLGLWQTHIERILAGRVEELGVPVYRGLGVAGLTEDDTGVEIATRRGTMHAQYLVGCDGGRSRVRKAAGIDFPGWEATTSNLIAEVEMSGKPPLGVHSSPMGRHSFGRVDYDIRDGKVVYADHGPLRVMVTEAGIGEGEPTIHDLRAALMAACGTDYGLSSAAWISRFTDATRQAAEYRKGRVLLAGDAAHIHAPDGGQGLQLGVHDAVNLGWKLAQVVKGQSPETLLDTYHAERHAVAARTLRMTMASVALRREDDHNQAMRVTVAELLTMDEPKKHLTAELSGLGIRYDLSGEHPLVGRRMPDLDLMTHDGPMRVFDLMQDARPLFLDFTGVAIAAPDHVRIVRAEQPVAFDLPVIGRVDAPPAVLVRPDGYVAWAGGDGLDDALTKWFGAP